MLLKTATWNLASGVSRGDIVPGKENTTAGYNEAGKVIRASGVDIVGLQEVIIVSDGGRHVGLNKLASDSGLPYLVSVVTSESHVSVGCYMGIAVLSRFPIRDSIFVMFQNPMIAIEKEVNGERVRWKSHDKGFLKCRIDFGGRFIWFVSGHFFPFHEFGKDAVDFRDVYTPFVKGLEEARSEGGVIVAADLNIDGFVNLTRVLEGIGQSFRPAGEELPTRMSGRCDDYILYEGALRVMEYSVTPTWSDHHYVQATFDV